jgi:hypothetical protein
MFSLAPDQMRVRGSARDITWPFYTVCTKKITTPFGDKIRFTLIRILLQKKMSLYCNLAYVCSRIFISLVFNFASIWHVQICCYIGLNFLVILSRGKYFITHFMLEFIFAVRKIRIGGGKFTEPAACVFPCYTPSAR